MIGKHQARFATALVSLVLPETLDVVRQRVNQFLLNVEPRAEDWVVLGNALEADGGVYPASQNKILMTVVNLQRELVQSGSPGQRLDLVVDLGFIANFAAAQYKDGLQALSLVIACLHQLPPLTPQSAAGLPAEVEKVSLEMINQTAADLNHLFAMMGLKYQPCVFYRLRLLPYWTISLKSRQPVVRAGELDSFTARS